MTYPRRGKLLFCMIPVVWCLLAISLQAQQIVPLGQEFQINAQEQNTQRSPRVATNDDGTFIVVWHDEASVPGRFDPYVISRRFDALGSPLEAEFEVNAPSTAFVGNPDVAWSDADERFVVVWQSRPVFDESYRIKRRLFNTDGTPFGVEQDTNDAGDSQSEPRAVMRPDGHFLVVWHDEVGINPRWIRAQAFDGTGSETESQATLSAPPFDAFQPDVSVNAMGSVVAVWQEQGADDIRGGRFSFPTSPQGSTFQINGYTTGSQSHPVVGQDDAGDFVVAFESSDSPGTDTEGGAILARRFASDGTPLGNDFQVNTWTSGQQHQPALLVDGDGSFTVLWTSQGADGDGDAIAAQRFASDGTTVGEEVLIAQFTTSDQSHADIDRLDDGVFVAVWQSGGTEPGPDGSGAGIQGRLFTTAPVPILGFPSDVPTHANETVTVPLALTEGLESIAAIVFSIDYDSGCLDFDPTDGNADNIPDAITFSLPAGVTPTVFFDLGDGDGEIDITVADVTPPITSLPAGTLAEVTLTATCEPDVGSPIDAHLGFSMDPAPTFSDVDANAVVGLTEEGSVEIFGGIRGDCSGNARLDAADLIANGLEIFDGDGNSAWDTPGGSFLGNPIGCDANADLLMDAGDITCTNRLFFGLTCGSERILATQGGLPGLSGPRRWVGDADGRGRFVIQLNPEAQSLNALAFSIDIDTDRLQFDPADQDGDGVPDSVRFLGPPGSLRSATFNAEDRDGELDVLVGNLGESPVALPAGPLMDIELQTLDALPAELLDAVRFADAPSASFGTVLGLSLPGNTELLETPLFVDGFESGDADQWSTSVP